MLQISRLIISRTDGIGDVILTLPLAGLIKKYYPDCKIWFVGRDYTKAIISSCSLIDNFINWDELSKLPLETQIGIIKGINADAVIHVFPNKSFSKICLKAKIPARIGTSHRLFHWFTCNKLVNFSRKSSIWHEAQLNTFLGKPLGIHTIPHIKELIKYTETLNFDRLSENHRQLLSPHKFNLILHPKSKGSAREWGLKNFDRLIELLPKDKYKIFISGVKEDRAELKPLFDKWGSEITDLIGMTSLPEFISFIGNADGLIAASTGPLHIAAFLGKVAIGLYAPMQPIHPGRWAPIGRNATFLVLNKTCHNCYKSNHCKCIESISPEDVIGKLDEFKCSSLKLNKFEVSK
jgi:heptosyltransferase III